MDNFRNAAKAFIVKDGKLLLLKRRANDVHKPCQWDIPGGRLEPGENPYTGLERETTEETGVQIEIILPLDVHYFTRDDGQQITLIVFLCKTKSDKIRLSEEHTEFKWQELSSNGEEFPEWLRNIVDRYHQVRYVNGYYGPANGG